MISVCFFLFTLLHTAYSESQFGLSVIDKTTDILFRDMGQAYVSTFTIVDKNASLQVVLEDTIGVDEFWVVDFQPYDKDDDKCPVEQSTGDIKPENTGNCSNVILNGPYNTNLGAGFYFKDGSNFRTIDVSLTNPVSNGDIVHKNLFEEYARGTIYNETDQYGEQVDRRADTISFEDDFAYFFECVDTDGDRIWKYMEAPDSIEYRTTMYLTNVRLRNANAEDDFEGVSWVTATVDLVYRIYRIAIVNFVFSSSALVRPTLNYVIIRHYPLDGVQPPRLPQAWIKIEFETQIESPDGELLSYINDSITYTPDGNGTHSLNDVLIADDSSMGIIGCVYRTPEKCYQTWTFYLVIDLEGPYPVSDEPIDATGTFEYRYEKHSCDDATADKPETCEMIPNIDFSISLGITIQTVVSLVNERDDRPTIKLVTLRGNNGEDLRGGYTENRRGVNHKETVTMVVGYEPELLHKDFDLQLTLFMVCKYNFTAEAEGCLSSASSDRYVAYHHDDFKFVHTPEEGEDITYTADDVSGEWDQEKQYLETNTFNDVTKQLTMSFISTALSQERLPYTITTVYKLMYNSRRRREAAEHDQIIVSSLQIYGDTHTRSKRDLLEAAEDPQGHTVNFDFVGCPPRSTYNPSTYDCDCPADEVYNTESFECYKPSHSKDNDILTNEILEEVDNIEVKSDEDGNSKAAVLEVCFVIHFAVLFIVYCFEY